MFTIICEAIMAVMVLGMAACATAALYIMKCDEMTREEMGVKI